MTTNVAFNAMPLPGMAAAPAPLTPADPALVDRFNQAMAPQSVQAATGEPPAATPDLSRFPQATDAQLNRLPAGQLERMRVRYGSDETALRVAGKVALDLIEKPIQQTIMKQIRKGFERRDD